MSVQRTRTQQLRALLTTGIQNVRSAISTHVHSIINWTHTFTMFTKNQKISPILRNVCNIFVKFSKNTTH